MESFLKAKTAGLPRWAWLAIVGGAVGLGLYLRSRSTEEPEGEEEEPSASEDSLAAYEGTESAGGLAAAGLIGPAQGQITPVEAPYIPQGFVDIFEKQGEVIESLANREPGENERVEVIKEPTGESGQGVTGGGPSNRKPHHHAPKKKAAGKKQGKGKQGKGKKQGGSKKHGGKKHKVGAH